MSTGTGLLAQRGVDTVFVSFPNLTGPAEIDRFAPVLQAFAAVRTA